jgi:hypothetical protein
MTIGVNTGSNDTPVLATLNGEYQIFSQAAVLPGFSRGECFVASGPTRAGLFALVGSAKDCFRIDLVPRVQALNTPGLLSPLACGVIDLPGGAQRYAMIFQALPSKTVQDMITTQHRRLGETEILVQYLQPLVKTLHAMADHAIFHGGISTGNLYQAGNGGLVLGECLSSTPSLSQPAWALPIERAMAHPALRGEGIPSDEMFSLGAAIAHMALGQMPGHELSEAEFLGMRIEKGSFSAMIGRTTLSNGIGEILRGLLEDNAEQRWTLEELERWIDGRRSTGHQSRTIQKPSRALEIGGVEYWNPIMVAEAFSHNPAEAMRLIANDELIKWVRRALGDVALAERIADAVNMPNLKGKAMYEAALVSRICIALHPSAPIRYMGIAIMPEAIGTALQKTIALGESPQVLAEIIAAQLPKYWYNSQAEFSGTHVPAMKSLEQARVTLERLQPGAGLERCLYDLAPGSPLLAQEFGDHMVLDMRSFVTQLELIASRTDRPQFPFGRHSTAFFMSHDAMWAKPLNRFASATSDLEKALGCLQVLASFQSKLNIASLPNIARWLEPMVQGDLLHLHNRDTREIVRADLQKAAMTGNLVQMQSLLGNITLQNHDHHGFAAARREHAILAQNISVLQARVKPGASLLSRLAMEAATAVAGFVAILVSAGVLLTRLGVLL